MRKTIFLLAILTVPGLAAAQSNRTGSWDFSVGGIYQDGDSAGGEMGSSLDVDSAFGLGFYFGYHFNNRFQVGADFDFLRPDYDLYLVDENDPDNITRINHSASQFNGRVKATLNLADGPLVPFVEAGFGWTYVDSNVADGPPVTGCWWHPYWGYICQNYYNTYSGTDTTYGGGIGVRYELRGGAFIKASANYWTVQVGSEQDDPDLTSLRIEYGWRF